MRRIKKVHRMASKFFVHQIESDLGEKVVAEIREGLLSLRCMNDACNQSDRPRTSSFGIKMVHELNGKGTIVFTSSSWCCNKHMLGVERFCFVSLAKHFTSDQIDVHTDHFTQESN